MSSKKIDGSFETEKPQNHNYSKQSSESANDITESEIYGTTNERNKIKIICKLIKKMQKTTEDNNVLMEDIIAAAEENGIKDAMEIMQKMKREGDLFEPKPGWFRKV